MENYSIYIFGHLVTEEHAENATVTMVEVLVNSCCYYHDNGHRATLAIIIRV